MTRLILAAGVAALAITAPASAKPGEHGGGNGGDHAAQAPRGGGGNAQARGGGGGGQRMQVQRAPQGGGGNGFRFANRGGGGGQRMEVQRAPRGGGFQMRSVERRQAAPRVERGSAQRFAMLQHGRAAAQADRGHGRAARPTMVERHADRGRMNVQRVERQQARNFDRHQGGLNRVAERQQLRANRVANVDNRIQVRDQLRPNRFEGFQNRIITRDDVRDGRFARFEGREAGGFGIGGCPPGLASKGCMPPGQAAKLLGTRWSDAGRLATFGALPLSARYLYPDTDDYYYRYGDGYVYRVDRGDQLISALLPLAFGGGYNPGSYFPSSYMNDYYVPNYYGFNSFYPDSPYSCNRYVNGLVYQMDCASGYIDNVIPLYDSGYGVGQLLPTGYGYYNVPYQYRDMYYDTSDSGYWYAPGAIYQYDPSSSLITSVAALLSPGFSVGQQLPYGYDAYNVPYDYRATYYDTPDAWYRYNNGGIYRVDPTTQLVTALVASILR